MFRHSSRSNVRLALEVMLLVLCAACGSSEPEPEPPNVGTANDTWADYGQGFMQKWCVNCHGAGGTAPDCSTESSVQTNVDSIIAAIGNSSMPMGATLSSAQQTRALDFLAKYQDSGSTGGDSGGSGNTSCTGDTYNSYAKGFFSSNCTKCHPSMSNYGTVSAQSASIQQDIQKNTMPQDAELSADDKSRILTWINCGMP